MKQIDLDTKQEDLKTYFKFEEKLKDYGIIGKEDSLLKIVYEKKDFDKETKIIKNIGSFLMDNVGYNFTSSEEYDPCYSKYRMYFLYSKIIERKNRFL
jgi:hypothetical protein